MSSRNDARRNHHAAALPHGCSFACKRTVLVVAEGEVGPARFPSFKSTLVALVVFLRGINVGGHRTFRPAALAQQLKHLDAINIGAAGSLVIGRPVTQAQLRAELARRLPFSAEIVICQGREIARLMSHDPFMDQPVRPDVVRFVSVLSKRPRTVPSVPMSFPSSGRWLLKVLALDNRFVFGLYRRHMKVIGYLGALDRVFGVPATTRNWNTITAIARVLDKREA
jgi:uncharacterized protein (DUF1697 family)